MLHKPDMLHIVLVPKALHTTTFCTNLHQRKSQPNSSTSDYLLTQQKSTKHVVKVPRCAQHSWLLPTNRKGDVGLEHLMPLQPSIKMSSYPYSA